MSECLFNAEDLKPCPLHSNWHYESEWREFEKQKPTQTEIYLFRQKLSERAARERNFEAMDIYGMPQWFYLANESGCKARQVKINAERGVKC